MRSRKVKLYWGLQLFGWGAYVAIAAVSSLLAGRELNNKVIISLATVLILGISLSHGYRKVLVILDWTRSSIWRLIPRILLSSALFALIFELAYFVTSHTIIGSISDQVNWMNIAQEYIIWLSLLAIWALIYFAFHYFENYRQEEIKNLKWEASKNEIELNKLKSQLNPHFLFNSMNSIKALINEDPAKAKKSVTQLSNILRNTLMMGKKKEIPFEEEFNLVKDYLDLETVRYEERLNVEYEIHPDSYRFNVPPLMIQTLIENGIKHGISKLPKGGTIRLSTKVNDEGLAVSMINTGQLNGATSNSGFGIKNTEQRLQLLYGSQARFKINNHTTTEVLTELLIPNNIP